MKRTLIKNTPENIGKQITVAGWASNIRDHGSLVFIDLRDWSGHLQLVIDEKNSEYFKTAKKIGMEYVVQATGTVSDRSKETINDKQATGSIELIVETLEILNECKQLPFPLDDDGRDIDENLRLKYRFIDIRRQRVRDLIENRATLLHFTRNWFADHDFTEVQTPLLTVSSPEGARDYLVPSRLYPGKFYALPQAPQQYKQLLMVGGLDRYYQIAPCFRDEDPRADRHSGEFYQIDAECSFIDQESFFELVSPFFKDAVEKLTHKKIMTWPFIQIPYLEAMDTYGSDKPDLRFGMKLVDITEEFQASEMAIFKNVECIKAIAVDNDFSRAEIDEWTEKAKQQGAKGLAWFKTAGDKLESSISKFFSDKIQQSILEKFSKAGYSISDRQTIFAIAGEKKPVQKLTGWLRSQMGDVMQLKDPNILAFAWIIDFPMYEWKEDEKKWDFEHNPFSMPKGGYDSLKTQDPKDVRANQYDIACNGYEMASGSIRNHDPKTFIEAFKITGYTEEEVRSKFGHMISAFEYGAPPHGGFAIGYDRLMMILFDESNIREVYAFPKTNAQELMTGCPREVPKKDTDILDIQIIKKEQQHK